MFNRLTQIDADTLRLQTVSPFLATVLRVLMVGFFALGVSLLLEGIVFAQNDTIFGLPVREVCLFLGVAFLVNSQLARLALFVLTQVQMTYWFSKSQEELRIEPGSPHYEDCLPRRIELADIHYLQLKALGQHGKIHGYLLELVLQNDQYMPLTFFKNERKGQQVLRQMQSALNLSYREVRVPDYSFGAYKQAFLAQFKKEAAA